MTAANVQLPVIGQALAPRRRDSLNRTLLQLWRFGAFCSIVAMLHWQHSQLESETPRLGGAESQSRQLAMIQELEPAAQSLDDATLEGIDCSAVLDSQQKLLGYAAFTQPIASETLGFSGPTNTLLLFSPAASLSSARIVESSDTRDHVETIRSDSRFLPSLLGKLPQQLRTINLDGVSGATLTSLAIIESIRLRCTPEKTGAPPEFDFSSLKFPVAIAPKEIAPHIPGVVAISPNESSGLYDLTNADGKLLGHLLRLSPGADNVVGYQGPTDGVLLISTDQTVVRLILRSSYDNQPYTDYVAEDEYFCNLFRGFTTEQLGKMDADDVEGVSGATMTSQSVAHGVAEATSQMEALRLRRDEFAKTQLAQPLRISSKISQRDLSTLLITAVGCLVALTKLKRHKGFRLLFQFTLIGWLGLINGDMISQALWLGWAQHGISWQKSLGLVGLSAAAICIPLITGQNAYCAHLCPHGAAQQLLRNRIKWRLKLSARVQRAFKLLPASLLLLVIAIGLLHLPISPVDLEPFDAWIWTIAGIASIAIAVVGLLFSTVVPMGYCRFGCPTGALLNSLRRVGPHWSIQDTAAGVFLLLAVAMNVLS